jgi:PAS domain S-box-containing protein
VRRVLRIGELARRTGVGVSTLRAWERRFGLPEPARTAGGQREYDDADIERVQAVVRLVAEGLTLPAAIARVHLAGAGARPRGEGEAMLFEQVLSAAPAGIWVTREGRTVYANRRMLTMMGVTYEELVAIPLPRFFADDELPLVRQRTTTIRTGQPLRFRQELHRPDGSAFLAEIESTPLPTSDGSYQGTVSHVRDVTAQAEEERRSRFDAALLELTTQAAFATSYDGRILRANAATQRVLGWPAAELSGRDVRRLLVLPEDNAAVDRISRGVRAGRSYLGTRELVRRDGTRFPARVASAPVHDEDGDVVGVATTVSDESAAATAEQAARARELQADTVARLGARALAVRDGAAGALTVSEVLGAARRVLGAQRACLVDESLALVESSAVPEAGPSVETSIVDYVLRSQQLIVVDDASSDRRFDADPDGPASAIAAPVHGASRVRGVLVVTSERTHALDAQAGSFVQGLANVVGMLWP